MVKLYKYDESKGDWVLVDFGIRSRAQEYVLQCYVVVYPRCQNTRKTSARWSAD